MASEVGRNTASPGPPSATRITAVSDDQWDVVAWLWQAFRNDLSLIVNGLPYADGRYQVGVLGRYPLSSGAGYLAWRSHPKTGEDAPVGFALMDGLDSSRRSITALWVAPPVRRDHVGQLLATEVLRRHNPPWSIGFQHDNVGAGTFWRSVADTAFGTGGWSETVRTVPGRPDVPPDHFIESL